MEASHSFSPRKYFKKKIENKNARNETEALRLFKLDEFFLVKLFLVKKKVVENGNKGFR